MHLTPREQDKLLVYMAAQVARARQARGLKLNYPEAMAILAADIVEGARDGRSVAELMAYGKQILSEDDVMPGVAEMIAEIQVEATFPDGTKLVTVHQPIPSSGEQAPGAVFIADAPIAAYAGRETVEVLVQNAVDDASRFAITEVITPGRTAMGERNAFRRLDLRLRIDVGGRARLIERALLDPRERPTAIVGSQGAFACSGTPITIGYPLPAGLESPGDELWLGADGGVELTVVRGLARAAEPLRKALLGVLECAEKQVGH